MLLVLLLAGKKRKAKGACAAGASAAGKRKAGASAAGKKRKGGANPWLTFCCSI